MSAPKPEWSHDGFCWILTAPDGYTLDGELHEFVYDSNWTKREAMEDARERMGLKPRQRVKLERCETPDCEWCGS